MFPYLCVCVCVIPSILADRLRRREKKYLIVPPCRKGKRRALKDVMDHWVISLMLAVAFTAAASSSELMDDDDSVGHLFDIDVRSDGESPFSNKKQKQNLQFDSNLAPWNGVGKYRHIGNVGRVKTCTRQ